MEFVRMSGVFLLLFSTFASSCSLSFQPTNLKTEEIGMKIECGLAAANENLTPQVCLVQNKTTFISGFENFADRQMICTQSSKGRKNLVYEELQASEGLNYDHAINVLSTDPTNIFDSVLHDESNRWIPSSVFSSQCLHIHTCHTRGLSSRELFDDEGRSARIIRLYSSEAPTIVVNSTDRHKLVPPLVCFVGSSVVYKVFKKAPDTHRGYRGKRFGQFSLMFSIPLLFAHGVNGSPLDPSLPSREALFSSQSPNRTAIPKAPLSPPVEPSSSPEVGVPLYSFTPRPEESPPPPSDPSFTPPKENPSSQSPDTEPSPTGTASLPTGTSDPDETGIDSITNPFDWKPIALSGAADLLVLAIALRTAWTRAGALIAVAVYVFIGIKISDDKPDGLDPLLGLIIWLNIGGFGIWYSFLDINALWRQRGSGPDHGYGAYFLLVLIVAIIMDLAYSGFMSAGDAKAFREAMADASTLCWTFSSILIGRITDMDEQYHPRQRQTITEDVEAARDEAPGQVTRGLLNERQRNDERSPVRGSKTWGDTFKSTFSLSSLLPSITSRVTSTFWSFLGRGTTKTDNSTNDTELNVFPSRSGQAGTDSIQTGGQGSEDRQEDSLHVVGDDSDEESERGSGSYSGHQIWRDPS